MRTPFAAALCGLALTTGSLLAQPSTGQLLDVFRVHVRRDKTQEYENLVRRLAEINRKKGDHWVAYSTEYGDSGAIYFASRRSNYGDIESGFAAMETAMKQAVGAAGMAKIFADLNAMSTSGVAEIRRRRQDLSVHPPGSAEELTRMVATSRWFRTIRIDLKPGRMLDFVDAWRPWQAEISRMEPRTPVLVSVTETGQPAVIVTFYLKSLKDMDETAGSVQKLLASDAYRTFSRSIADVTNRATYELHRLRPDLSNPPEDLIAADPDFWKPKPAAKPKPPAESSPVKK